MLKTMRIKTAQEVDWLKESAFLVSKTLASIASILKPGVTTLELDRHANTFLRDHGAVPSFFGYNGFPYNICTSVNQAVVHGLPDGTPLGEGDIVSVDIGAYKNGYHGDHAYTFIIGEVADDLLNLVKTTKTALEMGIAEAIQGNRVGDIGYAVQSHVESLGYHVVRDLVGHGLGKDMHEEPDIPNFGRKGLGKILKENLVIAIEPMVNLGTPRVSMAKDGWTILTADGKPSAHFEHDVCVKKGQALVLSDFTIIEKAEKQNLNLNTSYY